MSIADILKSGTILEIWVQFNQYCQYYWCKHWRFIVVVINWQVIPCQNIGKMWTQCTLMRWCFFVHIFALKLAFIFRSWPITVLWSASSVIEWFFNFRPSYNPLLIIYTITYYRIRNSIFISPLFGEISKVAIFMTSTLSRLLIFCPPINNHPVVFIS